MCFQYINISGNNIPTTMYNRDNNTSMTHLQTFVTYTFLVPRKQLVCFYCNSSRTSEQFFYRNSSYYLETPDIEGFLRIWCGFNQNSKRDKLQSIMN